MVAAEKDYERKMARDKNLVETTVKPTVEPAAPAPTVESSRIAEHGYLDADGNTVEDIEKATGISYKDRASGKAFVFQTGGTAGEIVTMFAIFGAKTRAGNTASAARSKRARDAAYVQGDVAYIVEVFAETKTGQWAVSGEGAGRKPTIDIAILKAALLEYAAMSGREMNEEALTAKLASDLAYRNGAFANADVKAIYLRLAGKTAPAPVDVFAL